MSEKRKVFDDFPTKDCNECERYWTNQCDGAPEAKKVPCNSFLATRRVTIPPRLKRVEKGVLGLSIAMAVLVTITVLGFTYIIYRSLW